MKVKIELTSLLLIIILGCKQKEVSTFQNRTEESKNFLKDGLPLIDSVHLRAFAIRFNQIQFDHKNILSLPIQKVTDSLSSHLLDSIICHNGYLNIVHNIGFETDSGEQILRDGLYLIGSEFNGIIDSIQNIYPSVWYTIGKFNYQDGNIGILVKQYDYENGYYFLIVASPNYQLVSALNILAYKTVEYWEVPRNLADFKDTILDKTADLLYFNKDSMSISIQQFYGKDELHLVYNNGIYDCRDKIYYDQDGEDVIYQKKIIKIQDKDGYINLRKAPNLNGEIIAKIMNGEKVKLFYKSDRNWHVAIRSNGDRGYIFFKQ